MSQNNYSYEGDPVSPTPLSTAEERAELIKDLRHFAAAFRGEGKEIEADLMDEAATALHAQSETEEDAARYRWFRDECRYERRIEIAEVSGTPDMLEHHIDKGRVGL